MLELFLMVCGNKTKFNLLHEQHYDSNDEIYPLQNIKYQPDTMTDTVVSYISEFT